MLRKAQIFLLGVSVGAFAALVLTHPQMPSFNGSAYAAAAEGRPALEQFREIYQLLREHYVSVPDDSKLIDGAIAGLVRALDPHSEYLDAASYRTAQEEAVGMFGGVGLQVAMENGLLKIMALVPNSHAAKAGLKPGDLIIRLDGTPVRGLTINHAIERMRGPVDSTITLTIIRKGQLEPVAVVVVRDLIRVQTVSARAIDGEVGYIRITKFNDLTGEGLQKALQDLLTRIPPKRLKGYILDLRNNPGGVLEQAISVSSAFLTSGDIVTTRGRDPGANKRFAATGTSDDLGSRKPLIVLINGGSASAAEIVAAALQDNKRATVLGTLSFGKGSVQSTLPIGTGHGALKLTTAFSYRPNGDWIQAKGVMPDIEVTQEAPQAQGLPGEGEVNAEALLPNHFKGDGNERAGSEAYVPPDSKEDKALNLAVDLIRGTKSHPAFLAH